ncbi:MAG: PrsW family glutamic-type intramembrane protease [Candidatus Bathyarchaeia archaeon]
MSDAPYFPPPPPPPALKGFHAPGTNFFLGVRMWLSLFERQVPLKNNKSPTFGLLIALLVSATLGVLISVLLQTVLLPVGMTVLTVFFAPLTEEPAKAVGMLIVAYFVWKVVPNRRYGAALGAASGLGFGVAESLLYIYGMVATSQPAELILVRILLTPFMHPIWSAFVGISVFAFVSRKLRPEGFPWAILTMFFFLGVINHVLWNGISLGLAGFGYLPIGVNVCLTLPIFLIILRDLLGGHFNFQNFFEPLPEPYQPYPIEMPIPPPPPPP